MRLYVPVVQKQLPSQEALDDDVDVIMALAVDISDQSSDEKNH